MKKRMGLFVLIGCIATLLSGCKAGVKEVEEETTKMKELIDEGSIFDSDYAITFNINQDDQSSETAKDTSINSIFIKDGINYYLKATVMVGEESKTNEIWVTDKDDTTYYVFVNEGDNKNFKEAKKKDLVDVIWENSTIGKLILTTFGISYVETLDDLYAFAYREMNGAVKSCDNEGNHICSASKNFSKELTFSIKYDKYDYNFVTKDGKLLNHNLNEDISNKVTSVNVDFNYDNQTVSIPNKDDYNN